MTFVLTKFLSNFQKICSHRILGTFELGDVDEADASRADDGLHLLAVHDPRRDPLHGTAGTGLLRIAAGSWKTARRTCSHVNIARFQFLFLVRR